MKILVVLCLLLMIPTALAYQNVTLKFNYTELNISKITWLNLTSNTTYNKTITIKNTSISKININYPKTVWFVNSTKIKFNLTLKNITKYNFTESNKFNLSIDNSSYYFIIKINYTYKNTTIKNISKPYLVIPKGNITINQSSLLANRRGTITYTLHEEFGDYATVKCDSWLSCEDYAITFTNDKSNYTFTYTIPLKTVAGNYSKKISFTLRRLDNNQTMTVNRTIFFRIHDIDVSMLSYNPPDECIGIAKAPNGATYEKALMWECFDEYVDWNSEQIKRLFDYYIPDNKTITEYVDRYVMVGNISKVTIDELTTCRSERSKLTGNLLKMNEENLVLFNNASTCSEEKLSEFQKHTDEFERMRSYLVDDKNKSLKELNNKWKFWTITIAIIVVISLYVGYLAIRDSNELCDLDGNINDRMR